MNWMFILIIFITALVCCCMGFKRFVWFLSIGYGFAVSGIAIASVVYGYINGIMNVPLLIGFIVMCAYGLRLGIFLWKREMGNAAYRKVLSTKMKGAEPPVFVKAITWLLVAFLYVCQTSGLHFRLTNEKETDVVLFVGIAISLIGACIEALADKQKSAQKAERPDMVATKGLFAMVRCPNYFGEILFWTGVFVAGITTYTGAWQWGLSIFGYICIVYIMVDGAKRMEKGHISRYGKKEEYKAYADKTPILFPLIPIYHLYKEK